MSALNNEAFIDIPTDLNNVFSCKIISATQEKDFTNHYIPYFQEAHSLVKRLEAFNITPSVAISNLIRDFGNINKIVEQHNDAVINSLLDTHKEFFDHCLKYPLDKQQRRSIVSEEDNCLVYDKGCFYASVPEKLKKMRPVASYWEEHDALGKSLIKGLRSQKIKINGTGATEIDLTQTSYSTIPSVDIELGNQCSDHSDRKLQKLVDGLVQGINKYVKHHIHVAPLSSL